MAKVLVIDDDGDLRLLLRQFLTRAGFTVSEAESGEAGLALAQDQPPDAVILDLLLPGIDGLEVLRQLRAGPRTRHLRVLMLTRKGDPTERIAGLELGADDYMPKPFSPAEVTARIRALLRRETPKAGGAYQIGPLGIDAEAASVTVNGVPVSLSATEFKLLRVLAEAGGKVLHRERLRDLIWGVGFAVTPRTVDVHLKRLREKLGPAGTLIKTARGLGYKLEG